MIREQIADVLDEVQAVTNELPEGSLERTLMTAAESNLTVASQLVFEVNRMRLAELLKSKYVPEVDEHGTLVRED